jgi:hypothetical protein
MRDPAPERTQALLVRQMQGGAVLAFPRRGRASVAADLVPAQDEHAIVCELVAVTQSLRLCERQRVFAQFERVSKRRHAQSRSPAERRSGCPSGRRATATRSSAVQAAESDALVPNRNSWVKRVLTPDEAVEIDYFRNAANASVSTDRNPPRTRRVVFREAGL